MTPPPAPTVDDVRAAAARLEGRVVRTRLLEAPGLSAACGRRVLVKCENEQHARAFKARGALNAALLARERGAVAGLLTFSSGNHGQAVALAAAELGVPCVVVAPTDARTAKLGAMEARGARVVLHGLTSAERMRRALELRDELGFVLVPPYDHTDVIAGQGTVGLELAEEAPPFAALASPVGGGGLLSGVGLALRALRPGARLVGVEPEDADDLRRSLEAGRLLANERPSRSACDGLRNTQVGTLNFEILRRVVDEAVAVTEDEVERALRLLERDGVAPVEPSGAAASAAVLAGRVGKPGDTVVALVSGGNA